MDTAHEIPDDGAPHAKTTECGCGPQVRQTPAGVVFVHHDQRADQEALTDETDLFG